MIRTRLTLWNAVVLAFVLTMLGTAVYLTTRSNLYGTLDVDLANRTAFLQHHWDDIAKYPHGPGPRPGGRPYVSGANAKDGPVRPRGPEPEPPPMESATFLTPERGVSPEIRQRLDFERMLARPRIITADRKGLIVAGDSAWDTAALEQSFKGQTIYSITMVHDQRVRLMSAPIFSNGKIVAVGQAATSLYSADEFMAKQIRTMLALLPIALIVTSLTGIYLTSHALRPVAKFAHMAGKIEATSLSGRLPVDGKDEFALLASTFNSMLGRLDTSFQRLAEAYETQRRFVADASHELKTPLTAIKTRVGVAQRGHPTPERFREHIDAIGKSADSMTSIVQDLLLLAKSDEGKLALRKVNIPLVTIVDEAISMLRGPDKATIKKAIPDELDVFADASLLERVLTNLIGNALRHTPSDGAINVSAATREHRVVIEVTDTGEGIPSEHVPHVFERFHRVDAARARESGGTGLGLAIAKSIIDAHGGTIKLASEVGKGTKVTIELPVSS